MHPKCVLSRIASYLLCASFILPQASSQGTGGTKVLNDATDAFINQLLSGWGSLGGVAVAVVRGDGQGNWSVETKGYGIATANGSRVTENTLFPIGSNSKLFTTLATGLLINNETLAPRLSWTSKIASVLPNWAMEDSFATTHASIIDLMSHRTGQPRHDFSYRWSDDTPAAITKLKSQRPSAEFRETFQYNNIMYIVLSYLPTHLLPSKIPFARYVKQHIFDPLGLSSTTYSYDVARLGHLADGMARQGINYSENPFGGIHRALPFWSTRGGEDGNVLSGPGGAISNAVDMATWLQTLLLNGVKPGTEESIISPEIIQRVSAGVTVSGPEAPFPELSPLVYGGGQGRSTYRGHEVVEHDGGVPGFTSTVTRLPFDNLGVAVLSNDNDYGGAITLIIKYRLIDEALGLDKIDWDGRFRSLAASPPPLATPRPTNASLPSVSLPNLAGIYTNAGYGKFELCYVSSRHPAQSRACQALAANLSITLPGAVVDPNIPTFISQWDSPWVSHIRLLHFDGDVFNISALSSFPTNNASAPFWTYGLSDTAFDTGARAVSIVNGSPGRRGVSLAFSGIWGAGEGVSVPQGKTARDRAEVVFDKVQ